VKPKWIKGPRIKDPLIVVSLIDKGEPVFMGHKCQNASWARGWQIGMIINTARRGDFFYALPNRENAK
jgi:hypothetical protein